MSEISTPDITSYESILKEASSKKAKTKGLGFKKTYSAYIVLILFIALSFLVKNFFKNKVETDSKVAFDKAVNSVMTRLNNKYNSNLQVVGSIQGLYDVYVDVVRDYFKLFSSVPTTSDSSIKTLMFVPKVPKNFLDEHIFNMKRQGLFDYTVHPLASRETYYPVEFIEPFSQKNIGNAGFDFMSQEAVKAAIETSANSNCYTATPIMQTLSGTNNGFYLIAPVYKQFTNKADAESRKNNFTGSVIEEVDVNQFFKHALGGSFPSDTSIIFEIIEHNNGTEKQIFKSKNFALLNSGYTPIKSKEFLNLADRKLEVKFYTVPNFTDWFQRNLPNITFVTSLLLSFFLFGFILSVINSRAKAIDLAERMTRSQRRIVESSKDIIAVLDMHGTWKSMNQASLDIFNISAPDLIGTNIDTLFANDSDINEFKNNLQSSEDGMTQRVDYLMKSKDNNQKWINWSFTISKTDQLIYAIGRDVTLEKLAEEQAKLRSKQIMLAEQFTREASEFKSYFMTKLSHQMRNSLTGILGYLELVNNKIYENDEEHDSYISLAEESSEELFTFVSDMVEVALGADNGTYTEISTIKLDTVISNAAKAIQSSLDDNHKFTVQLGDQNNIPKVVAEPTLLRNAFDEVFKALSAGEANNDVQIEATENPYEGATEVQMLTSVNPILSEMIDTYKANTNRIIEILDKDKFDILVHFAKAASLIRMMNGNISFDSLGKDEGNIVQITLPLNKKSTM